MRLDIQTRSFDLTPYMRTHIERRVHHAFDRVIRDIAVVEVRLGDINGPRGGPDKRCGLVVRLTDGQAVIVREIDTCAYGVVDRATTRAKRLVKDRLRKRVQRRRRGRNTLRIRQDGDGEAGAAMLVA